MARKRCLMLGACGECCGYIILLYSNLNIYKTIASARKLQEAPSFHKITLSDEARLCQIAPTITQHRGANICRVRKESQQCRPRLPLKCVGDNMTCSATSAKGMRLCDNLCLLRIIESALFSALLSGLSLNITKT